MGLKGKQFKQGGNKTMGVKRETFLTRWEHTILLREQTIFLRETNIFKDTKKEIVGTKPMI
jgi:hypothetical protein